MSCCATYRRIVSGESSGLGAGLARGALGALSVPYRWGSALVEIVKSGQGGEDVGAPVISVGNLTCGGTGKTPTVSLIVRQLLERGARPVILSRGYKGESDGANDEARMLARRHPDVLHLQGKDRLALARHASRARLGDVLVIDDAYQYQKLHRTVNVCCIDATSPFGYGAVLPRGTLREPLSSLYRARPVLITRAELATESELDAIRAEILRWNEHAKIVVSEMKASGLTDADGSVASKAAGDVGSLRGKRVVLASGIGNPDAFARTARRLGARVVAHEERGDHYAWTASDVAGLASTASAQDAEIVLTTEKDAVKLARHPWPDAAPSLRALQIDVAITDGADTWNAFLDEALAKR